MADRSEVQQQAQARQGADAVRQALRVLLRQVGVVVEAIRVLSTEIRDIALAPWLATASEPIHVEGTRVAPSVDLHGRLRTTTRPPGASWTANASPGLETQATCTRPGPGLGLRNVVTAITVCLASGPGTPETSTVDFVLLDGESGDGGVLWRGKVSLPAVEGESRDIALAGLWIEGAPNGPMTLETTAGTPDATAASVSMVGTTTGE